MTFPIEIVLKGRDFAVTESVEVTGVDAAWNDATVRRMLVEILRAIAREEDPASPSDREVRLQGFSWIVEPVDEPAGQVVIAIEIPMGAAVAGPFAIAQPELDALISRVIHADRRERMGTIH